jgi:hypothetical protein
VIASASLLGWIIYLLEVLPTSYRAAHWNIAWVGYDVIMTMTWLATSWAFWKQRQVAIPGAIISATFLVIDAWFDVMTSNAGSDFRIALALALGLELPTALLLMRFARKAVRKSILSAHIHAGIEITTVSLWKTPLTIFKEEENGPQNR